MSKNFFRYLFYKLLEMIAYAIPLGVLFGVNYKSYTGGANISFWAYIIALFVILGFKQRISEYAKKDVMVTVSLAVFIVAIIMRYIADQLLIISACTLLGCIISKIFTPVSNVYFRACRRRDQTTKDLIKIRTPTIPHKKAWSLGYLGEVINE